MSTISLTQPTGGLSHRGVRSAWLGFVAVLLGMLMDLLDSTIAQTAAPAIQRDLGGSFASLEWISAAYTLAMAVTLLLGSRLGDILGRRRMLLGGIAGFAAASTLCALAPTPGTLVAARALQGVCAAMMVPQGFGLVRELFGDEGQQKAFGILGPVMGLGAVAGPLAGGGLIRLDLLSTSWRAIFLINVPVAVVALVLGARHLPRIGAATPQARPDLLSVALSMAGGFGLVYPLIEGRQNGWPVWSFALLAIGVLAFAAFTLRQRSVSRRGRDPLVEPSLLRRRSYVAGLAVTLCFIGAMGGMLLALNVMLQVGLGDSPLASGLATATIPVLAIGGSISSSLLLARLGRTTMHIGVTVMAIGLLATVVVLHHVGGALTSTELIAPLGVTGLGMGMVFVPMFDFVLAGVEPHQLGSASGLVESIQQLAMSLGIAAVGTVLFDGAGSGHGGAVYVHAASHALLVAVAFLIAAGIAISWLPRHARGDH